jgi:hypothetical protein
MFQSYGTDLIFVFKECRYRFNLRKLSIAREYQWATLAWMHKVAETKQT